MPRRRVNLSASAAALLLLGTHAGLLLNSIPRHYAVIDEVGHLGAGLSHWDTGTYLAYAVNPPVPRMAATFVLAADEHRTDYTAPKETPGGRPEWQLGLDLARFNAGRYFELVCRARLVNAFWSLLAAVIVFRWARDLYGPVAGLVSLTLWCVEPTILAFAGHVVPDVPSAAAGLTATYVFWRYLRAPSWTGALAAGLLLGIAELTKFTLLVLYPVWLALWFAHRYAPPKGRAAIRGRDLAQHGAATVALSLLVINAGYNFSGTGRRLGDFEFVSRSLGGEGPAGATGNRFRGTWLGSIPVPLPADLVRGIDTQRKDFESNLRSYLAGELKEGGWWYYYFYALAVKLPAGFLLLVAWALLRTLARRAGPAPWADELCLLLPAATVLTLLSTQTGFSHHLRYALPAFPFLFILAGKLAVFWQRGELLRGTLVSSLLGWGIGSSLAVAPHFMSYFNEPAGGPALGHRHLLDSNIDWGQDLLFLKKWLVEHPEARPLHLAYFNILDPQIEGIAFALVPPEPMPGWHALSVNFLKGYSFQAPNGRGGVVQVHRDTYDYFRYFRPVARAGYSIYIYHLTPADVNRVRAQLGLSAVGND